VNQINSILQRIPLAIKMLILTIAVGIAAGGVLDYFQTKKVRDIFYAELLERLNRESQDNRIHFDNYIATHNKAVKLIISQWQFIDYIRNASFGRDSPPARYINEIPPWLPEASVLRSLIHIRYALLLDPEGRVREVYQGSPDAPPKSLLNPTGLLIKLSHNQSYMTDIDGIPFLITAESLTDHYGKILATLILASPIDSEFLASSLGQTLHQNLIALVGGEKRQIIATNKPELVPIGVPLELLEGRYIITGKSFFDEGSSDLYLQFISLIPVKDVESVIKSIILSTRRQRAVVIFILILSFSFIVTCISRHIHELTEDVLNLSHQIFGKDLRRVRRGDELVTLKNEFNDFAKEIIESRNSLIKTAEELTKTEEIYRLLFQKSPIGIFHYNTDLVITDCNERFVKILQSTHEKLIGLDMKRLKDQSVLPAIQDAIEGKGGIYEGIYRATTSSAEIWVSMKTAPIFDSEGRIKGGVGIVEDITERKQIEEELKRSEASYKEVAELLGATLNKVKKREEALQKARDAFFNMLEDITESYKKLGDLFIKLVIAMVNALDAKSPWTKGHSERVTNYAIEIAREMGLSDEEIEQLRLCGLLHDIGKIGIYDEILDKPGKLSNKEFELIKQHPVKGVEILRHIEQLNKIIPGILHHHERYDGSGYPDGLMGEDIPLCARILHVADSFDAMTSDRPYRPAPGVDYAVSELQKDAGTQFDPLVVEAFLRILESRREYNKGRPS